MTESEKKAMHDNNAKIFGSGPGSGDDLDWFMEEGQTLDIKRSDNQDPQANQKNTVKDYEKYLGIQQKQNYQTEIVKKPKNEP